jgi:hypothetical protein
MIFHEFERSGALRAENGDKANWSGMLRVCSPAAFDQLQSEC